MIIAKIISRQPLMRMKDGEYWWVKEPIRWSYIDRDGDEVLATVPYDFLTDLASVPCFVPIPEGPYNLAGVIHDWLYRKRIDNCTRMEADKALRDGCLILGESRLRSWMIYRGVRLWGWRTWNRYRRMEKEQSRIS